MNHCVPNWDLENGTFSSSDTVCITKGYWDSLQPKRSMPLENDLEELLWEKGPVVNKVGKRLKVWENEDAVLPGKPSPGGKDNTLDSVAPEIASSSGNSLHEDEVAQFLYYPLDDSFEREYCSDFFEGMQPNMYMLRDSMGASSSTINDRSTHINTQKELFMTGEGSSPQWTNLSTNMTIGATNFASQSRMSKEAMTPKALDRAATPGTGRSVVSQNGSDFFPRIRTATQSPLSKWQTGLHASNSKYIQSPCKKGSGQVSATPSTMLPPKPQAIDVAPLKSDKSKLVNFSHFSRPAVNIKANLQSIGSAGASSTSGIISKLDKLRVEGNSPAEPSIIESNNTNWTAVGSSSCANSKVQGTYQNNQNMLTRKTSDATATCSEDFTDSTTKVSDQVTCQNSEFGRRSLASGATEKCGEVGDGPEATVTSSSGGSGNSGGRTGKEAQNNCKRKGRYTEDSECQSEDVEFESMERKKPVPPRTTSKRSRAAEVHNLSERRRRDRINEKMRALQELIPHCNKSDKASMLDEAIEYLKTLQLQVQLMSMGGGMGMAPMVIPGSMQHFQVPQMAHLSHLGMGIGMGMGYSMGMLEMGGSSGRPVMPLPSMHVSALPGSALHCQAAMSMSGMPGSNAPMTRCPGPGMQLSGHPISNIAMSGLAGAPQPGMVPVPTSMASDMQERMQNTGVADPYKHYTNSHHMHLSPQVINGNLYNNSMPQQTLMQQPIQASSQSNGKATQNAETGTGNSGTPG